jgi:hypothetical protein
LETLCSGIGESPAQKTFVIQDISHVHLAAKKGVETYKTVCVETIEVSGNY